jgi:hypothetical protein
MEVRKQKIFMFVELVSEVSISRQTLVGWISWGFDPASTLILPDNLKGCPVARQTRSQVGLLDRGARILECDTPRLKEQVYEPLASPVAVVLPSILDRLLGRGQCVGISLPWLSH